MSANASIWPGLALAISSGLAAGTAMLPMKFAKRWEWENTWLVFSFLSQIIIPGCLATLFVRDLATVYKTVSASEIAIPMLLGIGWGFGNVLFGLSIARLGLALGYAIVMGSVALMGTLFPLAVQNHELLLSTSGVILLSGVALMAAGIAVSGWAGRVRDHAALAAERANQKGIYGVSLLLAIGCALLSPMLNYSFVWGHPIAEAAVRLGNSRMWSGYAIWPVTLLGGFLPNLAYCVFRLWRNRTWKLFRVAPRDAAAAAGMATLWMASLSLYGMAAEQLGTFGTSVGWGLLQAIAILAADIAGLWSGEWVAGPRRARRLLLAGVALLTLATFVMAAGNRIQAGRTKVSYTKRLLPFGIHLPCTTARHRLASVQDRPAVPVSISPGAGSGDPQGDDRMEVTNETELPRCKVWLVMACELRIPFGFSRYANNPHSCRRPGGHYRSY